MLIGQVVKKYQISHRTLRYYEGLGLLRSTRNTSNIRKYDQEALSKLEEILIYKTMHIPLTDIKMIMQDANQAHLKKLLEERVTGIESQIQELNYSKYLIESVLKSYGQNDLNKQSLKGFLEEQIFLKRKDERWLNMVDHKSKIVLEIGEGLIPIAISENSESLVTGIKKLREELRSVHHYDLDLINLKDNTKDLKAYEYRILINDAVRLKKTLNETDKNKQMDAILTNLKAVIL